MAKYRRNLPQLQGPLFLTDAGLETVLIFHEGLDLPAFAAFALLKDEAAMEKIRNYYNRFAELAQEYGMGLVLEAPTWRASSDWGTQLGYSPDELAAANRKAVDLMMEVRNAYETAESPMVVSMAIGPRGDGYIPGAAMSVDEAREYHSRQISLAADTEADMVAAFTLNYVEEAIGIAQAAKAEGMPVAISFTVETDGKLPTGQPLKDAISQTDAATGSYPVYYMINCAHPTHFANVLEEGGDWIARIGGLRANASCRSHEELNESDTLDEGNPAELGREHRNLMEILPNLKVIGGCCGTDLRHVREIARNVVGGRAQAR